MCSKLIDVKEIYVYSWNCPHCETDNSESSMEQLRYLTCEVCGQMYERTYKEFKKIDEVIKAIEEKEQCKNKEQNQNPNAS